MSDSEFTYPPNSTLSHPSTDGSRYLYEIKIRVTADEYQLIRDECGRRGTGYASCVRDLVKERCDEGSLFNRLQTRQRGVERVVTRMTDENLLLRREIEGMMATVRSLLPN